MAEARIPLIFFALLLCGCAATPVPAPVPMDTATTIPASETIITLISTTTQTAQPRETLTLDSTPTTGFTRTHRPEIPLPTLALPTSTVTDVPQPAATTGAIQFYKPGPMSKVLSPVSFFGYAVPGYDHKGMIELYGEDGSLLNSEILQLNTVYKWAFFSWNLPFTVRGAGELGRLSLSTRDQYERVTAIRSISLVLLADGYEILTPAEAVQERVVMEYPPPGKRIAGGLVRVEGEMKSYNNEPLTLELISNDGLILGTQFVPIPPGEAGEYFQFRVDIQYHVTNFTPVLLTLKQADGAIPGLMYLFSQEIFLSP